MPESTLHGMFLNKFAAETEVDCQQFVVWDFKSPILKKKKHCFKFLVCPILAVSLALSFLSKLNYKRGLAWPIFNTRGAVEGITTNHWRCSSIYITCSPCSFYNMVRKTNKICSECAACTHESSSEQRLPWEVWWMNMFVLSEAVEAVSWLLL